MRRQSLNFLMTLVAGCAVLLIATPSNAQRRWSDYQGERGNVDRLFQRVENRSARFVQVFDQALDESNLNGSYRENRLNERARQIQQELNLARDAFDRGEGRLEVSEHLSRAIDIASPINNLMLNRRMDPEAEQQWSMLRMDLNRLAAVFDVRQLSY